MNNKMANIHIYQQLNLKNKLSKQVQRQDMENVLIVTNGRGYKGKGEEVRGLISTIGPWVVCLSGLSVSL